MDQIEKKENYFVRSTIEVAEQKIVRVPCKIFLPEYILEKPLFEFRPSKKQFDKISVSHEGSFKATIRGFDKKKGVSIYAPNVYFSDMSTSYWGPKFSVSSLIGEPQHLQIIRHLSPKKSKEKALLTLWISPNSMLGPAMIQKHQETGDITYERVRQLEFQIADGIELKFDKYFRTKKLNDDEIKQWAYLVAHSKVNFSASNISGINQEIIPKIDDLLIIASLGSRTRTACVGWEAADSKDAVTYYRGDFTFPSGQSEPSFDQGLVWLKDFNEFLKTCFLSFSNYPNKAALTKSIVSIVPGRKKVLEESFLSTFSGLEALILDFRKREKLEFALSNKQEWVDIKKNIKKEIKNITKDKLAKEQRGFLYNKLDELNRIPLQIAFERFCLKYNIDVSDLWPLFKKNKIVGLSDIRNAIIHGDPLSEECHDAFWVAEENLRFMLERILIKVLDWDVEKSEVSESFLGTQSTAIKITPEKQVEMSKYISMRGI